MSLIRLRSLEINNCFSALFLFLSIVQVVYIDLIVGIIDLFHSGDQIWYSFVLMLIRLSSLAATGKIQKNI